MNLNPRVNCMVHTLVLAWTEALWSSRNRIMFSCPKWQAVCSGVYPACISQRLIIDITAVPHLPAFKYLFARWKHLWHNL